MTFHKYKLFLLIIKLRASILLLLIIIFPAYSQSTDKAELEIVFYKYRSFLEEKQYDQAFDYYRDDFLQYVPKAQLEKQFKQLEENENLTLQVKNSTIRLMTKILKKDGIKYCLIRYAAETHLRLNDDISKEKNLSFRDYFKKQYQKNYSFSEDENTIVLYKEQELIAIKEDRWQFVVYKKQLDPYMSIWVPTDVLEKLLKMSQ
ncbi:MAG: hypothetical protein AAFQ94_19880 [Bacteroidota bacterium]